MQKFVQGCNIVDKDGVNLTLKVIMPRKNLCSDLFLGDGASVILLTFLGLGLFP